MCWVTDNPKPAAKVGQAHLKPGHLSVVTPEAAGMGISDHVVKHINISPSSIRQDEQN